MDWSAQILPISSKPLNGVLHIQDVGKPWSSWEFYVGGDRQYYKWGVSESELNKLSYYPVTHLDKPYGIDVMLKSDDNQCQAAFHSYNRNARGGRHIYIGSRGRKGRVFTELYRDFLRKFGVNVGVHVKPIPVKLDFQTGNVAYVSHR